MIALGGNALVRRGEQPDANSYGSGHAWGQPAQVSMIYDRVPEGTVEVRRASKDFRSDNHLIGHVDGFLVDNTSKVIHLVLDHGHLWAHRDIPSPSRISTMPGPTPYNCPSPATSSATTHLSPSTDTATATATAGDLKCSLAWFLVNDRTKRLAGLDLDPH